MAFGKVLGKSGEGAPNFGGPARKIWGPGKTTFGGFGAAGWFVGGKYSGPPFFILAQGTLGGRKAPGLWSNPREGEKILGGRREGCYAGEKTKPRGGREKMCVCFVHTRLAQKRVWGKKPTRWSTIPLGGANNMSAPF